MIIPEQPPNLSSLITQEIMAELVPIMIENSRHVAKDTYYHWDDMKYRKAPFNLSREKWWILTKLLRSQSARRVNIRGTDSLNLHFTMPNEVMRALHLIDQKAGGSLKSSVEPITKEGNERYFLNLLLEESITSSQLEGAATTKKVARDMIESKRTPKTKGEIMIYNNYQAMLQIKDLKNLPLTEELIKELHQTMTVNTLDAEAVGRFRESNDVYVRGRDGEILHAPPEFKELQNRVEELCDFANQNDGEDFIHPVLKAIILHFSLSYLHPFEDGNGRTARALFYWFLAKQGYWLVENISISRQIKRAPMQYAKAFLKTETDDLDLTYFILHQLRIVLDAIEDLYCHLAEIREERSSFATLIASSELESKLNFRQIEFLNYALKNSGESISIKRYQNRFGVAYQTARTDLIELAEKEFLFGYKQGNKFLYKIPTDLKSRIQKSE